MAEYTERATINVTVSEFATTPYPLEAENGWDKLRRLPIEARFAERAGVKPVCCFIWDEPPQVVDTREGPVAVHLLGPEDGIPVVSFHGNPGSARGPHPTRALLEEEHVRWIAFDSFGFGESPFVPGKPFVNSGHAARDVVEALGYERTAVFARSGGVPRALGFAALHSKCVSNMILVAGVAPRNTDANWQAGNITSFNKEVYNAVREAPDTVAKKFLEIAEKMIEDEMSLMNDIWKEMGEFDRLVFELQPDLYIATAVGHAVGLAGGMDGWAQNVKEAAQTAGFEVGAITAHTLILHGDDDAYSSIDHAVYLNDAIPNSEFVLLQGGHFVNWLQIRKQLIWLREEYVRRIADSEQDATTSAGIEYDFKLTNSFDNYAY